MKELRKQHAFHIIAAITSGFLLLTIFILTNPSSWIDLEFSEEVQEHQNFLIDNFMKAISWFGNTWASITVVTTCAALLLIFKYKREAIFCLLTLGIGVVTFAIKTFINRPRP